MDGSAGSYWELRFDEQGGIAPGGEDAAALVAQIRDSGTQDLFVMSHGWGNSEAAADQLYNAMFNLIQSSPGVPSTARFLGVYWPSLWFPDAPEEQQRDLPGARDVAPPPPGRADAAVSGKAIAKSLADGFSGSDRDDVKRMGKLVDQGLKGVAAGESPAAQQERLDEFHSLLGKVFATRTGECRGYCRRTPARRRCSPPTTRATHTGSCPWSWGARRRRATCRASATSSARCGTARRTRCGWGPTSR